MAFEKQKGFFCSETGLPANATHQALQAGQVLLIVILTIIVASTIGLSLASRSITSLKSSTEEAESQKALAAAEAGIERAMQRGIAIEATESFGSGDIGNNSSYLLGIEAAPSSLFLLNGGNMIPKDEGADLWLAPYDLDLNFSDPWSGNLTVYWGESSGNQGCDNAALEIVIVSGSKAAPVSKKYAYDSCSSRLNENHFSAPESLNGGSGNTFTKTYYYKATIGISSGLIARIIPIYKDASIGIEGKDSSGNLLDLPTQGSIITSTGTSGEASRRITVFSGYPQAYLPFLSYGLFVPSDY